MSAVMRRVTAAAVALALVSGLSGPVQAQRVNADVSAILFEGEHYRSTPETATLRYDYERVTKVPASTGPSFKDTVELKLSPGEAPTKRNVVVTLFKGPMHRSAGPFDGVEFNPILIMMLEYHLGDFAKLLRGNPRYFKNAIRSGMRDRAVAEPVKIRVGGRDVDATRIVTKPYENDPQKARFGPFADTTYAVTYSDAVPGLVYEIRITAVDPASGDTMLEEVTRHVEN